MSRASTDELILAIDQGTTNSKAALIRADGRVTSGGSAPVGISSPHPDWVEQDADRLWSSALEAGLRLINWSATWQLLGPEILEFVRTT